MRSLVLTAAFLLATLTCLAGASEAAAEAQQSGSLRGTIVSDANVARLPGVAVTVIRADTNEIVATTTSDANGEFALQLAPGLYAIRAERSGFASLTRAGVVVGVAEPAVVELRLSLAGIREDVTVQSLSEALVDRTTGINSVPVRLSTIAPIAGDNFHELLPVVPGVVRGLDGRLSLKGGRPDESGLQVSDMSVTDPVTGGFGIELPLDAVESVEVLASPFAAEYGRFASGVTRVETHRSSNEWETKVSNILPTPRFRDGQFYGVKRFGPRLLVGGALVRDRLFLTQSAQYEIIKTRVPGLPDDQNYGELERFSSFTRLDADLAPDHQVSATVAVFPRDQTYVGLDTLNPEPVTPDVREWGFQVDFAHDRAFGDRMLLTSQVSVRNYDVRVIPQGDEPMRVRPDGNSGHFFSRQDRDSRSIQVKQSLARAVPGHVGDHLVKIGGDVLRSGFDGEQDFRPVEIFRADGTLSARIDFPGVASLSGTSTDVSLFAQDRWRVNDRVLVDLGLRYDHDGVLRVQHFSPRAGITVGLRDDGRGVFRTGGGLYYRRTPLGVEAFGSHEPRIVSHFDDTGQVVEATETFEYRSDLQKTPHALVWSAEYNHLVAEHLTLKIAYLRREGRNQFVVDPIGTGPERTLLLSTTGRSHYAETELTVAYRRPDGIEAIATYVRSRARGDYNDFDRFFGNVPDPLIRPNVYTKRDVDAPDRLILRGNFRIGDAWLVVPIIEMRDGFPYSLLNEDQAFVGLPNDGGRFPNVMTVDLAVSRALTVFGRRVTLGVRAFNLLNAFVPRDVQANLASPIFGTLANGIERRISLTFQYDR